MVNSDIVTRRQAFSARELCVTAVMTALVFLSGFIVRIVAKRKKAPVSRCTWDTAPRD